MRLLRYVLFMAVACSAGFPLPVSAAPMVGITVAPGDTLRALCRHYLENPDSCRDIYRLNRLPNPDRIIPGQRVLIPAELLRGIPADGVVAFIKGDVRYYRSDGDEGRVLQAGERLEEGGRIETGADGSVEVTFGDGSSFHLKPDSVLSIVRSRLKGDDFVLRNLFLKTGRVVSRIRKATGREHRYKIRTPSAVAGVRGTEFRVSVDAEETTRSEVLSGTVAVESRHREVLLREGEGTGVRKGESPQPPRPLLSPPLPVGLVPVYKSEPLSIAFTAVEGACAFRGSLARDNEMRDVVRDKIVPAGEPLVVAGLSDGTYFLQTASIDHAGLEGMPSVPVSVGIRVNPQPPHLEAPQQGAEYRRTSIDARWLRVGDAAGYRMQVSGEPGFTTPLVDRRVEGVEQAVELGYGQYHFRVASVAADGYQGEWSDSLSFSLVKPPPIPAPEAPEVNDKQMRIRVRDAGKGFSYRFQVARDEQFADILHDAKGEIPELVIPRPDAGTYYFRTSCIDSKGVEGGFSPSQSFVIESRFPYGALGVAGGIIGLLLLAIL